MTDTTLTVEPEHTAAITPSPVISEEHAGLSHLSERDQSEIISLRKESADKRVKAKELQAQLDEMTTAQETERQKKLEEDGQYKELLQAKETELEGLKPLKDENEKNKLYFTEQLETVMAKITPIQRELLEKSNLVLSEKLKYANSLVSEGLSQIDSPDSVRPGGSPLDKNFNIEDYTGAENRSKLFALRDVNPKLYQKILELKNKN